MRKPLMIATLVFALFANAQQKKENTIDKNIVKTNLTGYLLRNYNLSYERIFTKTFSLQISYSTIAEGKVPSLLESFIDDDNIKNINYRGNHFTVEPRFYLGKKGYGRGFYLAPYYRHSRFEAVDYTYNYEYQSNIGNVDIPILINGSTNANSAGLLIGSQWFLGKKENWVLDAWFLGAHYGGAKGDFYGKSPIPLTPDQQTKLKEEIDNLDVPFLEYETTVSANGIAVDLKKSPWAGVRAGVSIGYKF